MSIAPCWQELEAPTPRHPNELDLRRIERAIAGRARYKYVQPSVQRHPDGYLVRSPCCSRNIAADGAEIDVALLTWMERTADWSLFRRDHQAQAWLLDSRFARLPDLFGRLNQDPDRVFWQ
ncbi:hypothetical protein WSK_4105 [Novosphingobium sp. Rr 2-17]|uniref:DUF3024 domain-containing protein n=1 Tax=Novosphingobium sp. Rr 2-17 TaxID=555793 RepID=UPI000269A243|nr:DUF3024 domain-containing protein [Novosphingobium sp. Rr 2-17]EIZ77319.1 hypothetical protein WSK_4105 [Novosphingobium sp. Rr 2-17]